MTKKMDRLVDGVSLVVGVLGLLAGVYFWWTGQRYRELAFVVDPVRVPILGHDHRVRAPIRVLGLDGSEITHDVGAATLYLWNSGNEPIHGPDVLEPLVVTLSDDKVNVLKCQLLRASREVVNFTVDQEATSCRLAFRILEPNDGAAIQVIYEGPLALTFRLRGTVEGIKNFNGDNATFVSGLIHTREMFLDFVFVILLYGHLLYFLGSLQQRRFWPQMSRLGIVGIELALLMLCIALGIYIQHKIIDVRYPVGLESNAPLSIRPK